MTYGMPVHQGSIWVNLVGKGHTGRSKSMAKNVAKVVGATSSEDFLVALSMFSVIYQ